jgi:hypothetical protein
MGGRLTACSSRAYGAVAGVVRVASDVADAGIEEALVLEVFAIHVFDTPEAAGGDGGFLGPFGHGHLSRRVGAKVHRG